VGPRRGPDDPRPSGAPVALQGYLLDVTEKREAEERLRHQAFHDPLTACRTGRSSSSGSRRRSRAPAGGPGVALLILDIDDFKT
jgi:GGDEF domain-containing protein